MMRPKRNYTTPDPVMLGGRAYKKNHHDLKAIILLGMIYFIVMILLHFDEGWAVAAPYCVRHIWERD